MEMQETYPTELKVIYKEYPEWKKRAWRIWRGFFSGFLGSVGTLLIFTEPDTFLSKEKLYNWIIPIIGGAFAGGFIAMGKVLRDMFPNNAILKKLPV